MKIKEAMNADYSVLKTRLLPILILQETTLGTRDSGLGPHNSDPATLASPRWWTD
jgi:hypothetical protein